MCVCMYVSPSNHITIVMGSVPLVTSLREVGMVIAKNGPVSVTGAQNAGRDLRFYVRTLNNYAVM